VPLFENNLKLLFHTLVYKWGQAFAWHYYVFKNKLVFPCFTVLLFSYSLCCSFALLLLSLLLPFSLLPCFVIPCFNVPFFHYAFTLLNPCIVTLFFITPLFCYSLVSLCPCFIAPYGKDQTSNINGTKLLDENIDMDETMFMNKIHDKYMEIQ
jgi:hypothetical protein